MQCKFRHTNGYTKDVQAPLSAKFVNYTQSKKSANLKAVKNRHCFLKSYLALICLTHSVLMYLNGKFCLNTVCTHGGCFIIRGFLKPLNISVSTDRHRGELTLRNIVGNAQQIMRPKTNGQTDRSSSICLPCHLMGSIINCILSLSFN